MTIVLQNVFYEGTPHGKVELAYLNYFLMCFFLLARCTHYI